MRAGLLFRNWFFRVSRSSILRPRYSTVSVAGVQMWFDETDGRTTPVLRLNAG